MPNVDRREAKGKTGGNDRDRHNAIVMERLPSFPSTRNLLRQNESNLVPKTRRTEEKDVKIHLQKRISSRTNGRRSTHREIPVEKPFDDDVDARIEIQMRRKSINRRNRIEKDEEKCSNEDHRRQLSIEFPLAKGNRTTN